MASLRELRAKLADLRRRRRWVRWVAGASTLATAVLWLLLVYYAVDVWLEPQVSVRAVALVGVLAALIVVWHFAVRRWFGWRESLLDMAVLVERREGLGSDLVDALEFDSPAAESWGSRALREVVIERAAQKTGDIDVLAGFSARPSVRRGAVLAATAAACLTVVLVRPDYAATFWQRLRLGHVHYPTRTVIDRVVINGREVQVVPGETTTLSCAEGRPVEFAVHVSHELPSEGRAEWKSYGGRRGSVSLDSTAPTEALAWRSTTVLQGALDRLAEPLRYQVYAGDAWTDPAWIEMVPLPVVQSRLVATPPDYATSAQPPGGDEAGAHSIEVLEGSQVAIQVLSTNKPLARVTARLGDAQYSLRAIDAARRTWRLDSPGTPLASVARDTAYRLEMVDDDGLAPEHRFEGSVRIRPDRAPRINATVTTRHVVPTGYPMIEYRVWDDYGIGEILVRATIDREGASGRTRIDAPPIRVLAKGPVLADALPAGVQKFPLALSALNLVKGDRVELVLEATDYRGKLAGKAAASEALVLNVTDARGVESAVTELDPALEEQFQALIERQLDIGASK
ncbi:MAG: hypothetical protein WD468_04110 [Pirellulales bacterium]